MQIIEKTTVLEFWVTLVLGLLFVIVFLLKITGGSLLKQQFKAIFKVPFLPLQTEENIGVFNPYQIFLFLFTVGTYSLFITTLYGIYNDVNDIKFVFFGRIFGILLLFFIVKWLLELAISELFSVKKYVKLFIVSKWNYLFSVSFFLYLLIIIHVYGNLNEFFLIGITLFILIIRTLFIAITNKKLIFNKLFYFILYLCALEIAPLFILYKLMF